MTTGAERGQRKLAAIMFTDIKSFSKKMNENEEIAMQLLRVHDDTLKAIIEKYDGKIVKAIGDAFMVDFSSAVNAVKCAIEAQESFWKYNQGKETELERLEIRIGIHLGDVITDGNDIFGDGVNIASRIESVTEPNRICISQDVFSQIKNKMSVKTFMMGSIQLKNIPEPVDVYEILIDSIPDFAVPSKSAQKLPSGRTVEKATKREAKEAEEVEVARKKASDERERQEKETEEKVQIIYDKAEKHFVEGKFKDAEAEINRIFTLVAFHAEAQVLQAKIEEELLKKEEEERKHASVKRKTQQEINLLMEAALGMVENGHYADARAKIQEVYGLNAGNEEAKKLEERIAEEEKKKPEAQPVAEEHRSESPATPYATFNPSDTPSAAVAPLEAPAEAPAEAPSAPAVHAPRPKVGLRPKRRGIPPVVKRITVFIVVAAIGWALFPTVQKALFPRDSSLIVLPFLDRTTDSDTSHFGEILAGLITDDFSLYKEVFVISSTSASSGGGNKKTGSQLAKEFQVRYALRGEIRSKNPKLSVNVQLTTTEVPATLWEATLESDPNMFVSLRSAILNNVLKKMEVEAEAREPQRFSNDPDANAMYSEGVWAVSQVERDEIVRGIRLLARVVEQDKMFANAHAALGKGKVRLYKIDGERDKSLLKEAADHALAAKNVNPNVPLVYEVLGSAYRLAGRLSASEQNLEQCLALQPNNAECYRQMAMISIIEGSFDKARSSADKALLYDPGNAESQEVAGHSHYFKQLYSSALTCYDKAIALGGNSYLITTRYKMAVWGAGLSAQPVADYCVQLIANSPSNYGLHYWAGRAYQLSGLWTDSKKYLERGAELTKKVIEINPKDANAHSYLGLFYARLGMSAEGIDEANKGIELSGESATALYRKAQLLAILKDRKTEALDWLQKAVRKEFILWEVVSPDFAFLSKEPEYKLAISRTGSDQE